jgi:hypothetical protein
MVNHQVVGRRTKVQVVYSEDDAIGDGHDFGATRRAEIHPEVDALASAVGGVALKVSAGGVAIWLGQEPGVQSWRFFEGQDERPLSLRLGYGPREVNGCDNQQDQPYGQG